MWKEGRVRIVDIADELGVSTATVSNVIHGKTKKISAKTVEMVQRKLQERGYIPNMAATLLAQNDSHIIGVVMKKHEKYEGHIIEDPFIASSLNYLSAAIDEAGYFMMLKQVENIHEIVRFASMWNLDGMIIICFCEDEYQELRNEIRIPFVVYDGIFENKGRICNLVIDDFDGGRQMGEHFRKLGHRRVLCVSDNRSCMDLRRYEGFCQGFGSGEGQCAGFMKIPMQKEERHRFYGEHFGEIISCSAVFAVSDYYAIDLMQFLQSRGIRIPDDISLAGFDGNPVCEQVVPNLTSVRQDGKQRAVMAMELLRKMKEEPEYKEDILLPVQLIVRDSTAKYTK
ncbi:MAG: LacI family DNA-binding transcriptional regulator [Eubacteriales bacterium]|nr:LacI family DNA-binding transcriptional regulator [Eubacteriales bacterium]